MHVRADHRQCLQATRGVASLLGSFDGMTIHVGGQDLKPKVWKPWLKSRLPKNSDSIRFLSKGATDAPAVQFVPALGLRVLCELRQDRSLQKLEDSCVAVKAWEWNHTPRIQNGPFRLMIFSVGAICGHMGQIEPLRAALDPLAELSSNRSVPRPAEMEPGQSPLEELRAVGVVHGPCYQDLSVEHGKPVGHVAGA